MGERKAAPCACCHCQGGGDTCLALPLESCCGRNTEDSGEGWLLCQDFSAWLLLTLKTRASHAGACLVPGLPAQAGGWQQAGK